MTVIEVTSQEQFEELVKDGSKVLATFSAPAWCRPCQQFAPHFEKASEQSDAKFLHIDVDNNDWVIKAFAVSSVPTVMLFDEGKYVKHVLERTVVKLLGEISG